ncbi:hypothetical protein EV702DRAFT_1203365 [Suillus placidus]|uniref:Uncharacterized protein n=1 Tax=Suillus placidus TaxID=48579 RepID=A0A9P6ZJ63_9AGAM|nr:hypothetical protein EV702DRAFT_1203365 [Suillus placidus]
MPERHTEDKQTTQNGEKERDGGWDDKEIYERATDYYSERRTEKLRGRILPSWCEIKEHEEPRHDGTARNPAFHALVPRAGMHSFQALAWRGDEGTGEQTRRETSERPSQGLGRDTDKTNYGIGL